MYKTHLHINNKTTRFDPLTTKTDYDVVINRSLPGQVLYRANVLQRMFFETKYALENGAQVAMFTLTYNDKGLPKYGNHNVHSTAHIQQFSESLKKYLKRTYGLTSKFIFCPEYGEGGEKYGLQNSVKRGKNRNPHYHGMMWLYPDVSKRTISRTDLEFQVKLHWQGKKTKIKNSDNSVDYYLPYRFENLERGNATLDGDFITDYKSCNYVSKYSSKDVLKSVVVGTIRREIYESSLSSYDKLLTDLDVIRNFFTDHFFTPFAFGVISNRLCTNGISLNVSSIYNFAKSLVLCPDDFSFVKREFNAAQMIFKTSVVENMFKRFVLDLCYNSARCKFREFINAHGPKVLCSQGVGASGVDYVDSDGYVSIPSKNKVTRMPVGNYLLRKTFYETPSKHKNLNGNPCYIPNKRFIDLQCKNLSKRLDSFSSSMQSLFAKVSSNIDFYTKLQELCPLLPDSSVIQYVVQTTSKDDYNKLSAYHIIYRGRRYDLESAPLDFSRDFRYFLNSDRSALFDYVDINSSKRGIDYSLHPQFSSLMSLYDLFLFLKQSYNTYLFKYNDDKFQELKHRRQRLNKLAYVC